jgi:hypothetical protein
MFTKSLCAQDTFPIYIEYNRLKGPKSYSPWVEAALEDSEDAVMQWQERRGTP